MRENVRQNCEYRFPVRVSHFLHDSNAVKVEAMRQSDKFKECMEKSWDSDIRAFTKVVVKLGGAKYNGPMDGLFEQIPENEDMQKVLEISDAEYCRVAYDGLE